MSLTLSSHITVWSLNVVVAGISIVSNNGHSGFESQLTFRFESFKLRVGLEFIRSILDIMHEV
jgi:hypothetical protein